MLGDMPHEDRGRGPRCDSLLPGTLEGMTRRGTSGVPRVPHRRHPARPRADQAPLAEARPAPAPAGDLRSRGRPARSRAFPRGAAAAALVAPKPRLPGWIRAGAQPIALAAG